MRAYHRRSIQSTQSWLPMRKRPRSWKPETQSPGMAQNAGHWTSNYAKASNETSSEDSRCTMFRNQIPAFADGVAALELRLTTAVTSVLLFMLMVPNPHPHQGNSKPNGAFCQAADFRGSAGGCMRWGLIPYGAGRPRYCIQFTS
jgi:hypothetical protein